jgi:hypothetical protein
MPIGILRYGALSTKFPSSLGDKGTEMIQPAAKFPKCGVGHNPLVQPSFREALEAPSAVGAAESEASSTYTWFCEACGETYQLEVADG